MLRRSLIATIVLAWPALSVAQRGISEPLRLTTGAAGGTFFDYGAGLAKLVEAKTSLRVAVSPSGGSIENLRRLEDGSSDLGLVAMGPAFEAWTASAAPWTGSPPLRRARALLPMYETPFHLATTSASGLRTVRDLDGKKVGIGPKGGSNEIIFARLADGVGIRPTLVAGDPNELADRVISGDIDATFFGAGAPIAAYAKIANAVPIVFIPLDGQAAAVLRDAFPYLAVNTIPAHTYKGQTAPVPTVALWNFLVARDDLPAEQSYTLVKAVLSDPAATRLVHPAAAATASANVPANTFMTFHPGALRFYDEAGVPVAGNLR